MATKAKSLESQRKELEEKLADIQKQEADIVTQKKQVIGEAVWAEMQSDDEYSARIMSLLETKLTKNADRALFGFAKKTRQAGNERGNG